MPACAARIHRSPARAGGRVQVVHRPVRVVADDVGGAARHRPVDRRVDLAEQQPPALLARPAGRAAPDQSTIPATPSMSKEMKTFIPNGPARACRPRAPPSGA